jgi:hypothetical protein
MQDRRDTSLPFWPIPSSKLNETPSTQQVALKAPVPDAYHGNQAMTARNIRLLMHELHSAWDNND